MLVRADDGAVDHLNCAIAGAAGHQGLENAFKYPGVAPTGIQRQMVFHLPKRSGKSRQGAPVRAIHTMPSSTRRLSREGRQARPRSGGRNGAISA